jgi:hypothetical protein
LSHADGAHGIHPFGAFTSQKVFRAFPLERAHVLFAAVLVLGAKHRAGTPGRSLWALPLPGIPGDQLGFSRLIRWVLPWVLALPGRADESLGRVSPSTPLTRFSERNGKPFCKAAPQSFDRLRRALPRVHHRRFAPSGRTALIGFLHRHAPEHSGRFIVRAMYSPHAAYSITANRPAIYGL